MMKSSSNCSGFSEGEGEVGGAENITEGGRIIVGNSFHFIKPWSPKRQGHSDER